MTLARWNGHIQTTAGAAVASAYVEVRREDDDTLALLYSDREGETPKANPFQADASGYAFFHAIGAAYRVRAYATGFERVWRYVGVGLGGESDSTVIPTDENTAQVADLTARGDYDDEPEGFRVIVSDSGDGRAALYTMGAGGSGDWGEAAYITGGTGRAGADGGILMTWSTSTTDADPGGGYVRANNADLSAATMLYVDKANRAGSSIAALLAAVPQGRLTITDPYSEAQAAVLMGVVEDATGYVKIPISGHSGATGFAGDLGISLQFPDPSLADMVRLDAEDQTITGGARVTPKALGNLSGATITPDPGDRPMQTVVNNGAGSILPGSNQGSYTLIIKNASGAGAITTTGWTLIGDAFDTTSTSRFVCSAIVEADVKALFVRQVA